MHTKIETPVSVSQNESKLMTFNSVLQFSLFSREFKHRIIFDHPGFSKFFRPNSTLNLRYNQLLWCFALINLVMEQINEIEDVPKVRISPLNVVWLPTSKPCLQERENCFN